MNIEEKVLDTITKYNMIQDNDKVVIGVSGGPDSMTLLTLLNNLKEKLNINIYVAHINHMIREEADDETEYVKQFCKKINVECFIKKIKVEEEAKKLKIGTEEAGRNIRYQFFNEVAEKVKANKIATAHNSNDNAETVLMNIIRGTSIAGLKGIEKIRDGKYIRPLIECSREEIEDYCQKQELDPKYDKSNNENIYTRNKVRNLLIPYIKKEFNPNIVEGINRLSILATEYEQFLNNVVENEYKKLLVNVNSSLDNNKSDSNELSDRYMKSQINGSKYISEEENYNKIVLNENKEVVLALKEFNKLDYVIKSKMILYTISKVFGKTAGIEKKHIDDIIKLCSNNIGNKYLTPKKGLKIFVKRGKIFFLA